MEPKNIEVRALSPALRDDFLSFFDGNAFSDNPRWASCYCQFMYVDHRQVDWKSRTLEQNRLAACERIRSCRMQGYLAYREGRPVGWCNAAPRSLMDALADEPDPDAGHIGHIGCFIVAKEHRRSGVATALLRAACDGFTMQGLKIAEGTPVRNPSNDAEAHLGPLSLYLASGFEIYRARDDGVIQVRRTLT